ncbi:MAG: permease [Pseudomonadota bacterium]|nr:permease [Pseudomonadota bacterium]
MSVFVSSAADRRLLDDSRATRAMTWIMAIMLFLTLLAAAAGLGTRRAAILLDRQLAGRLTVQIVEPQDGARAEQTARVLAVLRSDTDIARVTEVDRAKLTDLLRPWLGPEGSDPDLPIPAMIDVDLAGKSGDDAVARVTSEVQAVAPAARIDRHERWMSPVADVMSMVTWLATALVLLMAGATAAVVILAARAGLDTHRETIDVMHMLGSTDVQVARLFQRRIALDTLIGGVIGAVAATGVALLIGAQVARLGSDLVDGLSLAGTDWLLLALLPVAFALLATLAARIAVLGALKGTL